MGSQNTEMDLAEINEQLVEMRRCLAERTRERDGATQAFLGERETPPTQAPAQTGVYITLYFYFSVESRILTGICLGVHHAVFVTCPWNQGH